MKQSLNFSWSFVPGFNDSYLKELKSSNLQVVNIPHNCVEVPYNYFSEKIYQDIFTYEKLFDVEDFNKDKKYLLHFEGFMFQADIYLNEEKLGHFVSGYLPVTIDVSKVIKEKNNRLLVVLNSIEDNDYPPFGFALDYLTFSGIYREVSLISHLDTYLDNFYIRGDLNGNIDIEFDKVGEGEIYISHLVKYQNQEIAKFDGNKHQLKDFKLWDIDHPELYTLITKVKYKDEEEVYYNHFAFRKVEFTNQGFFLNDKKVKLVGLNRHQGYPYMGYAASKALQEDDAIILKNTGVNVVRTSHYPQSEHFLNKCDEIGLLVVDEIPGWQHLGKSETWRNACVENTRRMVLKERNHPSVITYGVRVDESVDDHELYTKTNEIAHKLDPYRQTIGVRNFRDSELLEDIYGYNDFSCDSMDIGLIEPKLVKHLNKGYLVTEYLGHMDPVKPTSDIDKKIEVALRHAKVQDDNFKHEEAAGAIGWCFVDYHSHTDFGSGDHICPHGVYDLYRNPKLSSYIYSSQQDNIPVLEVLSNFKPGDVKEAIFNDIYIATNCDYIELYKNDEFVMKFKPESKAFPHLKHPPILLDDIVGETFNETKFPKKSHLKIAKMFSYAAMHGFNHLPLKNKLYLGYMMARYKVSYTDLVGYWNKYVGSWGGIAKTYKVKGYINNILVKEVELGPSNEFHLEITANKLELVNDNSYDTLKLVLRHLDEHNSLLHYSNRIVHIDVDGPLSLVGPSEQVLLGGQLSLYFNSTGKAGKAKIKIKMDNEIHEFDVVIK